MSAAADLVLTNGRIRRGAGPRDAQAITAFGGRVPAAGSAAALAALIGPATRVVHLGGRLVRPELCNDFSRDLAIASPRETREDTGCGMTVPGGVVYERAPG